VSAACEFSLRLHLANAFSLRAFLTGANLARGYPGLNTLADNSVRFCSCGIRMLDGKKVRKVPGEQRARRSHYPATAAKAGLHHVAQEAGNAAAVR
jgi:hypothetical protein